MQEPCTIRPVGRTGFLVQRFGLKHTTRWPVLSVRARVFSSLVFPERLRSVRCSASCPGVQCQAFSPVCMRIVVVGSSGWTAAQRPGMVRRMNARTKAALLGLLAALSGAATDYLLNLSSGACPPAPAAAPEAN